MGYLIIGTMWSSGVVMFAMNMSSPTPSSATLLCWAMALIGIAWVSALCHAVATCEGGWLLALVFLPFFAMWAYVLWGLAKIAVDRWLPGPVAQMTEPTDPLVWRQALHVAEEAEKKRKGCN